MKTLRQRAKGRNVVYLQRRLQRHGYQVVADGAFGRLTLQAVEQFQAAHGLKVDGVVGPRTWDYLQVERRDRPNMVDEITDLRDRVERYFGPYESDMQPHDALRFRVLQQAISDIGLREQPDGSNSGLKLYHLLHDNEGRTYWEYVGVKEGTPAPPWCAIACSSWIRIAHGPNNPNVPWEETPMGAWFGAVAQFENWTKKKEQVRWLDKADIFEPGAVFVMSRDGSDSDPSQAIRAGHCGLVIEDLDNGYVITVEGNVTNAVVWRKRKKSTLRGAVVWWNG